MIGLLIRATNIGALGLMVGCLGACSSGPENPSKLDGFAVPVPGCEGGQIAVVRQRGPHRPNSDLVNGLPDASGMQACANQRLVAQVQVFLDQANPCVFGHENSQCMRSSDCEAGRICRCAGVIEGAKQPAGFWRDYLGKEGQWDVGYINQCLPVDCPANCGGLGCAATVNVCGRVIGFKCHTPDDECGGVKGFCESEEGHSCAFDSLRRFWRCSDLGVCD